jgi:Tfp pilus assembly protein PilW
MKIRLKQSNGFTLVELLLYIAITVIIVTTISTFLIMIMTTQVKAQTVAEVEQQGLQVKQLITQTIRNAAAINLPVNAGDTGSTLSVNTFDLTKSPTIFTLNNGTIYITEGTSTPLAITSSRIITSSLVFARLGAKKQKNISIDFTLSHYNPSNRNEYYYVQTFYATANAK